MTDRLAEVLQTERLILRRPRESDALALFEAYTRDAEVARYMVWRPHAALTETEGFIAACIRDWPSELRRAYVLALRDRNEHPVGMLDARRHSHVVDIGYVLARSHWGKGLMPEAIRAFTTAALRIPGVFRVQATCDIENRASVRALEKSGFAREARLERHTLHPNISPGPRPCFMYARCK